MNIGGLGILNRTSSNRMLNILSWHSPHSLTWRWILSATVALFVIKPYAFRRPLTHGHGGFGFGIGKLLSFGAWRDNNGWQFSGSVFWLLIEFSQQPPMWYRDLCRRERDEELERDFASQQPAPVIVIEHPTLQ